MDLVALFTGTGRLNQSDLIYICAEVRRYDYPQFMSIDFFVYYIYSSQ